LRALTEQNLHELTRLYPAVVVDVARARMYGCGPTTCRQINQLAIRAHGLLYRREQKRPLLRLANFLLYDYPRLFRRLWPYMALATALFLTTALGAYATTRLRPSTAYLFVPGNLDVPGGGPGVTAEDISERYRQMHSAPMSAQITTNNISVAFTAFALGITAGIGTCYVLLLNAMMLGGFTAHFVNHGYAFELWSFIVPHGALEIFAILVSGAAGLRLGLSLAIPGAVTRKTSLRAGAREAVLLVLGTIPMFIVAGVIEGFVTPSWIVGEAKIIIGIGAVAAFLAYLLVMGRKRSDMASVG
jgi:uncharacterized membrane protein SpoIIM required for sporulation